MARIPDLIPWIPRLLPLIPRNTPRIDEQIRCPAGTHRRIGGGCEQDSPPPPPVIVELPTAPLPPRVPPPGARPPKPPPDEARGPLPLPPVLPPTVPAPSPVDVLPAPAPRVIPGARPAPVLGALTIAGALGWVLGTLVIGPYFTRTTREYEEELRRPSTSGPPRRRGRINTTVGPAPREWPDDPFPDYRPLPGFPRIPIPQRGTRVRTIPVAIPDAPGQPMPARPRAVPRPRAPVQTLPAPLESPFSEPLPGPGYDPFTYAPTAPAPRSVPRSTPRRSSPVRLPFGLPVRLPGDPATRPGRRVRPLTPQPLPSSPPLRPQPIPRPPGLTPLQDPVPGLDPLPGFQAKPTQANPCTEQREARRRRQRECKRYTTKTIRVCADRS